MADFEVKIVVVGSARSGKSSLVQRLVTGRFVKHLGPTYAPAFEAKKFEVDVPTAVPPPGTGSSGSAGTSSGGGATWRGRTRWACTGIWDTGGSHTIHSISRKFVGGAHAVLVCWDPTSRASWDALRAWVSEVRREEPGALIFLCGCKADLLAPQEPPPEALPGLSVSVEKARGPLPDDSTPGSLPAADATDQRREGKGKHPLQLQASPLVGSCGVDKQGGGSAELESVPGSELTPGQEPAFQDEAAALQGSDQQKQQGQQQQGQARGRLRPEQLQNEERRQPGAASAAQGAPTAQPDRRSLEAPATPAKAEERQSPSDPAAPPEPAAGQHPLSARPAETLVPARDSQQAEREQLAEAAMPAWQPEGPLWSPFAAVARGPASPAAAAVAGDRWRRRSFGSSRSPAPLAVSFITSQDEWDALSVSSRRHLHSGHSASPQHGVSFAATPATGASFSPVRRQGGSEAEDEGEGERHGAMQLQQAAVPQAAVSEYCSSQGLKVFWASAKTGDGAAAVFQAIVQAVVDAHQQQGQQRAGWFGRAPLTGTGTAQGLPAPQPAQRAAQRLASADIGSAPSTLAASVPARHSRSVSVQTGAAGGSRAPGSERPPGSGSGFRSGGAWGMARREYEFGGADLRGGVRRAPDDQPCCIS